MKPETARISVVIPTYNNGPLVRRAVRSALAQTRPPYEVIVVDDGSTDGTAERLKAEFPDQITYHWQPNGGPSRARNTGVKLSTGDWVAFLDADDEWAPEKLESQSTCTSRPGVAIVACDAVVRDKMGISLFRTNLPRPFDRSTVTRELRVRTAITMSGVLVKRAALLKLGGFSEELVCGEDREMWARLVSQYDVAAVHEPLLLYTRSAGSLSYNATRVLHDGLIVNRRVLRALPFRSPLGFLQHFLALRKADAATYGSAAWIYAEAGQRRVALSLFLRSLWAFPFYSLKSRFVSLCKLALPIRR